MMRIENNDYPQKRSTDIGTHTVNKRSVGDKVGTDWSNHSEWENTLSVYREGCNTGRFLPLDDKEFEEYLNSSDAIFDERVYDIVDSLAHLLIKKQADYGPYNIASAPGGAMNGLLVRMHDKLARIVNLTKNNKTPQNEPLQDSFMDLANYCIIAIMVMKNWWEGAQYPEEGTK